MRHRTPESQSALASPLKSPRSFLISRLPRITRGSGFHSRGASADGYDNSATKSLVEQFYRGGVQSKRSSHTDVTDLNALLSGSRSDVDSAGDKSSNFFGLSGKSDQELIYGLSTPVFEAASKSSPGQSMGDWGDPTKLRAGYLTLPHNDIHSICPEMLSVNLINVGQAGSSQNMEPAIDAVQETLRVLYSRIDQKFCGGEHYTKDLGEHEAVPGAQLEALQVNLDKLRHNVSALEADLIDMTTEVKILCLKEIQEGVQKLQQLDQQVLSLSLRLNAARESMAISRLEMVDKIGLKLKMMEEVSQRFQEYDRKNRQQKGQQLVWGLSIFVMTLAISCIFLKLLKT